MPEEAKPTPPRAVVVSEKGLRIGFEDDAPQTKAGPGTIPPSGRCCSFSYNEQGHWDPPQYPGTPPMSGAKWVYDVFIVNSCPKAMTVSITWATEGNREYSVPAQGHITITMKDPRGSIAGEW